MIKENVISALKFTSKVGFIDTSIWLKFFAVGNRRWKFRQFQQLIAKKYLQEHSSFQAKKIYVLSDAGKKFIEEMNFIYVTHVPVGQLQHDRIVGITLWELQKENMIQEWLNERELRKTENREYLIDSVETVPRYPDPIFKINMKGDKSLVALEYERSCKTIARYNQIFWQYTKMNNLSLIIFVCEDGTIRNTIKKVLKKMNHSWLNARVGFVSVFEWQSNPLTAVIEISNRNFILTDFCQNFS